MFKDVNHDLKRKLIALLLTGIAVIMLMGAGVEQPVLAVEPVTSSVRTEEPSAPVEEPVDPIEEEVENNQEDPNMECEQPEEQPVTAELDRALLLDGQPVPKAVRRTTINGMTYVSLKVMSQQLDTSAQVNWDCEANVVTVTTDSLVITAREGDLYMVANGRYLYMPEGVQVVDGQMMVCLDSLAKAFDASTGWDNEAGTFLVQRGSGAIVSGDEYYREDDLFWLSRVIYAESGNQILEGKMAVGNVVLNRVNDPTQVWPDTIHGVLSQRNQFSTYRNGRLANRTPNAESVIAAKLVLDNGVVEEVKNAYFFDAFNQRSWAARNKEVIAEIGGHRFYG